MQSRFGPYNPSDRERLERERYESLMNFLGFGQLQPASVPDPMRLAPPATMKNAGYPPSGLLGNENQRVSALPFHQNNRNKDGTWEAPLADRDNILGTSIDPHEPVWPRWKRTPPPHHEGDFVSDDPFFDIDEISGKVEFYPPGRPLRDGNVDGNPARRQRVDDLPTGNSWRRRLLIGHADESSNAMSVRPNKSGGNVVPVRYVPDGKGGKAYIPDWTSTPPRVEFQEKGLGGFREYGEWKTDVPYWYVNPKTGVRKLYTPNGEPFRGANFHDDDIPDEVRPGNPDGAYFEEYFGS
jgi:hypothetical protein